jgi:hypothetical protein
VARILERGLDEGLDAFRFHTDMNVNDEHGWRCFMSL